MSTTKKAHSPKRSVPTVFLHGFSGEGNGLREFANFYVGKDALCINMPGFGGTTVPTGRKSDDIREYCIDVWTEIRKAVPKGPIRLVGHSHGAMIGYVLAVQHPKEVVRLDLFCPVARPRFVPRFMIRLIRIMRLLGVPSNEIISWFSRPFLVSLVTRYTSNPTWSSDDRQRIIAMRQRESQFYSPVMFDLMQQTLQFTKLMEGSRCSVPTHICHVRDENVASRNDYKWYESHTQVEKIKAIFGGHLCVVANPERAVSMFEREEAV